MQGLRQFASAFLLAFFSIIFVLGSLSLSLAEVYNLTLPEATATFPAATPMPLTATSTLPIPVNSPTATSTFIPTNTPQLAPSCQQPPAGWISAPVLPNDTLNSIAARYNTTPVLLRMVNCMFTDSLVSGSNIYVPPFPTQTPVRCGPYLGWVKTHVVRPGEYPFIIARSYGVTTLQILQANCLSESQYIYAGQVLWVPNVPTRTPTSTATLTLDISTPYPTLPLTATALPFTETVLPYTATILPTNTAVPTNTLVPILTASPTAFPP